MPSLPHDLRTKQALLLPVHINLGALNIHREGI